MATPPRRIRVPLTAYLEADLEYPATADAAGANALTVDVVARNRRVVVLDNHGKEFATLDLEDSQTHAVGRRFVEAARKAAAEAGQ